MPERKFCRTCKGTKQKPPGAIRLKEKARNTMNNPARQTNRSITRGATFALLALLAGIAVMSPAWLSGRAGEKHHADKHKDKNKGEKHHGEKHHGTEYRWDIIHVTFTPVTGRPLTVDAGGLASAVANDGTKIT